MGEYFFDGEVKRGRVAHDLLNDIRCKVDQAQGFVAVTTTYSLDLSALLASMLPLGFGGDASDHCQGNPVFMLHALKRLLPKLYIFCDAAEIKYPQSREHRLLNMLDQVVFPIRVPNAFHPKIWLLKYVKGKEARYRLIVLSKNISFDRSWDVAMSFDGTLQEAAGNGAPLAAMLVYLKGTQRGKTDRLSRVSSLAKEIEFVSCVTSFLRNARAFKEPIR